MSAHALAGLREYLAETDPMPRWLSAYNAAKRHYDAVKWPSYALSFILCAAIVFGTLWTLFITILHLPISIGLFVWIGAAYDAWFLRFLVGALPWLPWPGWVRDFTALHQGLAPFNRVIRRSRGESEE